jgi:predicted MFS family arabinose efflux permease
LLVSVFCASTAAMGGVTVLGKQVYDLTHRELDLGLLGLAEFAPAALLVLVTGAVADRFDRRRVASLACLAEAGTALGLAAYTATDPTAAGPIFAIVFFFGVARAFVAPASRALPADVVEPDALPRLVARTSIAWQSAIVVGPVAAGFLYAADPVLPYLAMAALLVAAAAAMTMLDVRRPTPATEPATALVDTGPTTTTPSQTEVAAPRATLHDALEGLRFIRRQPVLLGAVSLDLFAVLFGGAVALLPAIAEERLGVGAVGLGWLRAAGGIGAGLVTLTLAFRPVSRRVGPTLLAAVALFGAFTVLLGTTRSYVVAFVALAVLSGADAVSVFVRATLVPLVTPDDMRGRVLAVENVFIGASNELGAFESGVAGQLLGPSGAIVLGGFATLAIAVVWATLFPALRRIDRFAI